MTDSNHIDCIVNFLAAQMDGEQPPLAKSPELAQLSAAVSALTKSGDRTLQLLGNRCLGLVINRVRSGLGAEAALINFIAPGDDHA